MVALGRVPLRTEIIPLREPCDIFELCGAILDLREVTEVVSNPHRETWLPYR